MPLSLQYLFEDNCNDSVNNHHGIAYNATYDDLPEDMNIKGKAIVLNGNSSYINIATPVSGLTKFTVEFWYYPRVSYYSGVAAMFVAYGANNTYPMIDITQSGSQYPSKYFVRTISINPFVYAQKIYPLTLNTWQYIAVTWKNSTINAYYNGSLQDSFSDPTTMSGLPSGVQWIGRGWQDASQYYINGKIANFRIYDTVLTETEIASHYRIESSPPPLVQSYFLYPRRSRIADSITYLRDAR